ncbi:MAG: carbon-nitrogen hydrolase family protein [Aestuariibacter sp.]
MPSNAQLVAIQLVSEPDKQSNLQQVEQQLQKLDTSEPTLVVLPECFGFFGASDRSMLGQAEALGDGLLQTEIARMAKQYQCWIVAGTIPVRAATVDKFTASCLVFDDAGQQRAVYQKIHLFDVEVADNTRSYCESKYTLAGNQTLVLEDTPFGRLAVAVCYDLRFAGQFLAMQPFDVLALPAAFTQTTGKAHWHALLQARSIENQSYIVAANQGGTHANGRETFGDSCVYSPWGELLAKKSKEPGVVMASMDPTYLEKIRTAMPVVKQNRFRSELV